MIGDDGRAVPGPSQRERLARRAFGRLRFEGKQRVDLERLDSETGQWVTVDSTRPRIALGTDGDAGE